MFKDSVNNNLQRPTLVKMYYFGCFDEKAPVYLDNLQLQRLVSKYCHSGNLFQDPDYLVNLQPPLQVKKSSLQNV